MSVTSNTSTPAAPGKAPPESTTLTLMVVLTVVTGVVDSVGYLGLDRVFVGNMTGNIVILGMGLAGADELPVLGPAIALAAFTAAAFVAGLVLRTQPSGWTGRVTMCLAVGSAALVGCTIAIFVIDTSVNTAGQLIIAAVTAATMGTQAAVARKVGVKDMTTVVVTSTLTSLASESWMPGGGSALWNRRIGAILAILIGAVVGAIVLQHSHLGVAMALAAALTVAVTVIGHVRTHRP
ncbi:YoaK family protein [Rhodococcus opacus]|uniref:YoaK family protein n=1 Tax=Rhodococcus opacus TaxID=37919 RepID=UPI00155AF932|nr:YoaK family protein [Rhodococcus opacus]